jgi:hypothetical protein
VLCVNIEDPTIFAFFLSLGILALKMWAVKVSFHSADQQQHSKESETLKHCGKGKPSTGLRVLKRRLKTNPIKIYVDFDWGNFSAQND